MRVGLLVVGHVDPKSVHVAGDYPELFGDLLAPHGLEVVPYAVEEGRFPDRLDECDGWLCSPSRCSVNDDRPWIRDLEELHRRVVAEERPYVGICFGHQLMARALGGRVERAAGGWEVGVHDYDVVVHAPWMQPPRSRLALIASHEDQVVAPPPGAEVLASAADGSCPVAGMLIGERAWTLQPHPEFVAPLADHLLAGRVELIGADRVTRARASLAAPTDAPVIGAWIARFLAQAAAGPGAGA